MREICESLMAISALQILMNGLLVNLLVIVTSRASICILSDSLSRKNKAE